MVMNVTPRLEASLFTEEKRYKKSTALIVFQAGTMLIIMAVSMLANGVICHCILKNRSLQTITNSFIMNLAATDFFLSLLCMPFALVSCITEGWIFGETMCAVSGFFLSLLCVASILTLVLVAIDRYVAIKYPLKYSLYVTNKSCALMLSYVWLHAFVCALLPAIGWGNGYAFVKAESICRPEFGTATKDNGFTSFLFITSFVIPFTILISIYVSILWTARKQFRRVHHAKVNIINVLPRNNGAELCNNKAPPKAAVICKLEPFSIDNTAMADDITSATNTTRSKKSYWPSKKGLKRRHRARGFKMLLVIVAVFLVCWSPHFILIFYGSHYQIQFPPVVKAITTWLTFLNSSFNPFLYGFLNAKFRASLKDFLGEKLLCCRWRNQDD